MKRKKIFFDMDDVLADWSGEENVFDRFKTEKNFYRHLKPNEQVVKVFRYFCNREDIDVEILSVAQTYEAMQDKYLWVEEHLPWITKDKVNLVAHGSCKQKFVEEEFDCVLVDDYHLNCEQWVAAGGRAYIFMGGTYNPFRTVTTHATIPVMKNIYGLIIEEDSSCQRDYKY